MDHANRGAQRVKISGPLRLDWGGHLPELEIEFETWGQLARQIENIFYRSRQEFNTRFSCKPIADPAIDALLFDFHKYLDHQGRKILGHFDPNAYLRLSLSMDLHDLSRGSRSMDSALQAIESKYLVIGVPQDPLIPIDEQLSFHRDLVRLGKKSIWVEFSSPYGHDSFLKEFDWQRKQFRAFLD